MIDKNFVYEPGIPPGTTIQSPLETIQQVLDEILPGNSVLDTEFDASLIEHSDLNLNVVGNFKLNGRQSATILKPRNSFKPKLRTTCAPARQPTQKQAILSLNKRNWGGSSVAFPKEIKMFAQEVWDYMGDTFFIPNWRAKVIEFQLEPLRPNSEDLKAWFKLQSESTKLAVKRCDEQMTAEIAQFSNDTYQFILKNQPKVALDLKPQQIMTTVQTVMFHNKEFNALFGPLVKRADERFRSLLRPNCLYNKGKNLDQIEDFINNNNTVDGDIFNLENDFGDYDRSQLAEAFSIDEVTLRNMGLDLELLHIWMQGHYKNTNISISLGIILYLRFQRKSGDVTTAFGNTTVNMASTAWCYKLRDFKILYSLWLGDDSYIRIVNDRKLGSVVKEAPSLMANMFNLEAKPLTYKYPYFCGYYILNIGSKLKLACDPIRRSVKLGRWDVKSEPEFREHWVSFGDCMRNYEDQRVQDTLGDAVRERYQFAGNSGIDSLVSSLFTLRKSFKEFRRFWQDQISLTKY